ncbi:Type IV secretory pathway, VirB10 component (plasmid) [Xanthomonas citri pv. citri]|uniref:TrbI/VirB10 family protein n=1 Tax=Xanthomonas citri TaxID=346 RepID=UPI0005D85E9F|nr:TrbI/VirB10 family protein [Xanthomonas citri]AJY88931.1 Type IV secretory pathway, VirB10 component [Xanthomonas citri pv. citri]AJZ06674.1 Type IV secretory pathway, VirB10 component [Xanthomonas citri pv. citri]AJZ28840.1 Type IV secretory pathway, VirB10 component [Xanthomonas citri pv. citri]AJZ33304.1 Type IV secretory pathway, VirB10 component [Xanthomonas citri pv. citri]AJZ37773.1 Type IV secretory pathway, VirB10 component [Xanthomonas citri pv. citri]
MSDQTNKPQEDREVAVREWEKQANASLVADDRKKKMSGIAIAAIAAVGLGAVWYMKHGGSEPAKPVGNSELSIPERKPVPKLKEQESASAAAVTSTPAATPANATQADDPMKAQREQMEMQRQEQERRMLEARRKSAIIPPNSNNQAAASAQPAGDSGDQGQSNAGMLGGGSGDRGAQDPNSRFARAVSGDDVAVSKANQIDNLPYKVLQGKLIEAVLEPRAISDLPGMVCATVQRDVYGAQDRNKLIPWGSRVCGVYSAEVRKGQDRLFVIWNTVRRPDGVQVALDSAGADQLGTAGMGGIVDTHFAGIFGTSALLSIIGAGASNAGVSSGDQYNSAAAYRQSVQQAAAQTSQSVLQPYINIPPTITVPAGSRVRIYVNKDLDFTAIYKDEIDGAKRGDGVTFIQ